MKCDIHVITKKRKAIWVHENTSLAKPCMDIGAYKPMNLKLRK